MSSIPAGFPLADRFLIGVDFGTASARGVLIDIANGRSIKQCVVGYPHGVLSEHLPDGRCLPKGFALHHPHDYLAAAEQILTDLGGGRLIDAIGIASTASSPLLVRENGSSFVIDEQHNPHAYVKLWKHAASQPFADELNAIEGRRLLAYGGPAAGEGFLAKAAEAASHAPELWRAADRFIEVGDWLTWQLTGIECRSMDFASFKAHFVPSLGYPDVVPGLLEKVAVPAPVGTIAGGLSTEWLARTGIKGTPVVSVPSIDSHAVLPALGIVTGLAFVGSLGTSSGFLLIGGEPGDVPAGYEHGAQGAALPSLWCCEAGQAALGDMFSWFMHSFPGPDDAAEKFAYYNAMAQLLAPGQSGLLALDWFGGSRVPHADKSLSGLIVGLRPTTTPSEIYRALIDCAAFGIRNIVERGEMSGATLERVFLTSSLAFENTFLVQTICDVVGRPVEVPEVYNATAVGAAIHAAVASGVVSDFAAGAAQFGPRSSIFYGPDPFQRSVYNELYRNYVALVENEQVSRTMKLLSRLSGAADIPAKVF